MTESEPCISAAEPNKANILAITSGKSGVGKTCFTANLGVALAQQGYRVCILDTDARPPNIDTLLNVKTRCTLEHLINGERSIEEVLQETPYNVHIVPAASGLADCGTLDSSKQHRLFEALAELESSFDYVLIDTAGGSCESDLNVLRSAEAIFLMVSPDPASLTDAFSLLRSFSGGQSDALVHIVVNMVNSYDESIEIYARFLDAVNKYLRLTVEYGGYIPLDEQVTESIRQQKPVVVTHSESPASHEFFELASSLDELLGDRARKVSFSSYWQHRTVPEPAPAQANVHDRSEDHPIHDEVPENQKLEQLFREIITAMKSEQGDSNSWKFCFQEMLDAFVERFDILPIEPRQILYESLELNNYPEKDIQEIVAHMESLFQLRYQRPLRNLDDTASRLLADAHGSEDKIVHLGKQLRSGFKRQFQKDLFDARQEVIDQIHDPQYSEQAFQDLMDSLRNAYRKKFGTAYKSQSDLILAQVRDIAAELTAHQGQAEISVNQLEAQTKGNAKSLALLSELLASSDEKS